MIGASARSTGSKWPLFGVLAVLCGVVYVAGGMLHEQALDTKIRETEDRVESFASQVVAPVLQGVDLSTPLGDRVVARLRTAITSEMTDPSVARMRIYGRTGTLLFSTDDGDRIGTKKVGDPALITAALSGATRSDTDADEVAARDASGSVSAELIQAYAPIAPGATTEAPAVLQLDHRYGPIAEAAATPWATVRLTGLGGAGLFLLLCFAALVQWVAAKRQSARSGFVQGGSRLGVKQAKATEKLEAEVERLRAQLQAQERAAAEDSANFQEQLRAAVARSEQISARPPDVEIAGDTEQRAEEAYARLALAEQRAEAAEASARAIEERLAQAEADAAQAKASAAEAEARAAASAAEAVSRSAPDEHDEPVTVELEMQLAAARTEAARLEQQVVQLEHRMLESDQALLAATQRAEAADAAAIQQEALVARAGEAERLVAEAEGRAAKAEDATVKAEDATAKAEARASEAAAKVTALEQQVRDAERRASEALAQAESSSAAAAEADQARARVAELEAEVAASVQRAETAEARLSGSTTELSAENARLRAEVQAEQQRGRMATARAEEAEARLTQLEGHASTLAQSLEDERVHRERSAADADRAQRELAETTHQVAELEARAVEADRVAAAQERRAAELQGELESSRAEAATASVRLTELESAAARLPTLEGELADLRRTSDHAEKAWIDRVQGLENELAAALAQASAARSEADAELQRASAALADLGELDTLRQRLERSEAALAEQTARASRADAHAEQAEMRVRELSAEVEMERATLQDRLDQEMEQMRTSIAEADAAASEARGEAEFKVRQLEEAVAQSASRAEDAERRVIAATERAEDAERRATENAFALQAAEQRARDALERTGGPTGAEPSPREDDGERVAELERALGDAERELEQTQVRARRAYADAEDARAQLKFARERGDLPGAATDPAELDRLRAELAATIERAKSAEDLAAMLQADLLAAHRGVDPDGASDIPNGEDGSSLRSRLARAADRKRGRSQDGWS